MSTTRLAACFSFLILAASPAWADSMSYYYMIPPHRELVGVKRIAIGDLEGPQGRAIAESMISRLLSNSQAVQSRTVWAEGASPVFLEVIERQRLFQVLSEQGLGSSGLVNESSAAQVGQLLGVNALVLGTSVQATDQTYEDIEESYYVDKVRHTRLVRYFTRYGKLDGTIRVVEASSGKILMTVTRTDTVSHKEADVSKLPPYESILQDCARHLGAALVGKFTPGYESRQLKLKKDKTTKEANRLAEQGSLDAAWAAYTAAASQDPYNDQVIYNLGAMHEAVGDYERALELYRQATQINAKEKDYVEAQRGLPWLVSTRDELAGMGFAVQQRRFDPALASAAQAQAAKTFVIVRKKAADLSSDPGAGTVLASLPKNMKLEVTERRENGKVTYYKVTTFDGKTGWLSSEEVKEE